MHLPPPAATPPPAYARTPEDGLLRRLRMLEEAQRQAGLGAWSLDLRSGALTWSAPMFALCGLAGPDVTQAQFLDRVHPADRDACLAAVRALLRTGGAATHQLRVVRHDGAVRHLRGTALVETDPATGDPVRVTGSAQDVTEVAEREAALRTRAAHLDAVAAASRAILTDPEPRAAICRAAQGVTDAVSVTLLEVDGTALVGTASSGPGDPAQVRRELTDPGSLLVRVLCSGQPVLVEDTARHAVTDLDGAHSALCVPVFAALDHTAGAAGAVEPAVIGVLAAALPAAPVSGELELLAVLQVLAGEAGVAIERADLQRRLAEQARTDGLTGLANRRTWDSELPLLLRRAGRSGGPVALAMLDLDHFKSYNDTHGHAAGDELLRAAAEQWSARLRGTDLLARYGGEEFVLALPDCDVAGATALLAQLRAAVPRGCTASVGLTVWDGQEDGPQALRRADAALYDAKDAGRDQVRVRLPDAIPSASLDASPAAAVRVDPPAAVRVDDAATAGRTRRRWEAARLAS